MRVISPYFFFRKSHQLFGIPSYLCDLVRTLELDKRACVFICWRELVFWVRPACKWLNIIGFTGLGKGIIAQCKVGICALQVIW